MKITLHCLLSLILAHQSLQARDVLGRLPSLSTGLSEASLWNSEAKEDNSSEGGLDFGLSLDVLYDSNVNRASGSRAEPEESDVMVKAALSASYLAGDSNWRLGANANLGYRQYFERDDYNDPTYGLSVFGGYNTSKTLISFSTRFGFNSGVNAETGTFLDQISVSSSLMARYNLTGKTSLLASWNQSFANSQTSGFNDTTSWTAGLSAIWRANSRLNFGPGIRYGVRSGRGGTELTSWGPTFRLNYDLSSKVSLRSSVGLDYTDSSVSEASESLNWSLGLDFSPSKRWGVSLSTIRDTQSTVTRGTGFDEVASVQLTAWRRIRQARASLGFSYQDRSVIDGPTAAVGIGDSQLFSTRAGLSMPIFMRRANLDLNLSYMDFEGRDSESSWDGFQAGVGLGYSF